MTISTLNQLNLKYDTSHWQDRFTHWYLYLGGHSEIYAHRNVWCQMRPAELYRAENVREFVGFVGLLTTYSVTAYIDTPEYKAKWTSHTVKAHYE